MTAAPASPLTNNGFGVSYKIIKDSCILRKRLQFSRFQVLAKEILDEWSTKYIKNSEENVIAKLYLRLVMMKISPIIRYKYHIYPESSLF